MEISSSLKVTNGSVNHAKVLILWPWDWLQSVIRVKDKIERHVSHVFQPGVYIVMLDRKIHIDFYGHFFLCWIVNKQMELWYAIPRINMLHNWSCCETRFRLLCRWYLSHSSLNLAFRQCKLYNIFIFGMAYCVIYKAVYCIHDSSV